MPLAGEIKKLRDLILADLAAAQDYFLNTKAAWRIVRQFIERGGQVKVHNQPS